MEELVDFWFKNSDMWFSKDKYDTFLSNKYSELLNKYQPNDNIKHNLGLVLLWDQIIRHIYRSNTLNNNNKQMIKHYHTKALDLSITMIEKNEDMQLEPDQRCFLLMPLRHTFDIVYINFVIERIKFYNSDKYNRFYKATLLSYSKLITQIIVPEPVVESNFDYLLDQRCFEPINHNLYKLFEDLIKTEKPKGITLSISGGVDSMVCAAILIKIKEKYNFELVCVMVNYNNRIVSKEESLMVSQWLNYLDVDLYVRHITHLKRNNTERNFYESVTKQFRFDLYRRFGYPVVLGHNKDDTIENLFTNIRKKRNYNDLRGMSEITIVDKIKFYRPLLSVEKQKIYEFARYHYIPFLVDSTPKWSDRGRMRDELIPFINNFDSALIPGILSLSNHITDMIKSEIVLVNTTVNRIVFEKDECKLDIDGLDGLGFSFWKSVIQYITSHYNIKTCSNKSIENFVNKLKSHRVNLSNNLIVLYEKNQLNFKITVT